MRDNHSPALCAFRAIARHGSFTRAAAELEVTASALSQTLRQLEERLGTRLLQRTTRKVGLTEAGALFLEKIAPALTQIDDAIDELHQHGNRPAGSLRITVPGHFFLEHLIAPHLTAFLEAWPEVKLDVIADSALVDLVAEGIDAGIRLGERLARDVVAIPLGGPMRSVVVGSPAYFARHGRPQHPRDLQQHACARFRYASSGAVYRWEFAHKSGPRRGRWFEIEVNGPLTANDPALAIRAARDGLLLVHTLEVDARNAIASGQLETVLEGWLPPYDGFYLYYPSRRQVPPKLRAFIDFMRMRLGPPA
ncbi:LysR family transcriptional regulator [Frateuria sp. Soil773]|uniref:LysR family transcriptional regulator n=1 Tax=Frateuria sp. Soil773 TaxID=1736407 RepID=UPI0006FE4949|nr:LysR family transcriptional regulator [Frateuria sp. Soil773]KRE94963.1 LysR family transcriptional regulator [Frateuria sp. Soil773]